MAHRRTAPAQKPCAEQGQACGDRYLGHNRSSQRATYHVHHDCFFLSLRTRSTSALSASSSSSLHDASATRDVIICLSEPPKKVCRYCCNAVRLAAAGEMVAE